ncbi:hypothetical protein WPS_20610 [Vulcanimicrobium alpinum]|uniref:Carboxypeptidase regulatory-like domain-containing protein n=2 Tax=Vulcanimicrobium alpinum TaxID=3016050 RepID=A0AAN1XWP9_UNVUL|nr:hypothetical protein WPS_20610 [Vulcanimicrobium alpinum]
MSAAAVPALLLAGSVSAGAQGPATIRGVVYSCGSGAAVADARVDLRGLDGGRLTHLTADAHGRFARVGVEPGRYLIVAFAPARRAVLTASSPRTSVAVGTVAATASRSALVETDDVLDVRIGIPEPQLQSIDGRPTLFVGARAHSSDPSVSDDPHPACDPPTVPMAVSTANRYIIH